LAKVVGQSHVMHSATQTFLEVGSCKTWFYTYLWF